MICLICREAETGTATTTVRLERDGLIVIVRDVPAQVCPECGEAYVDEVLAVQLLAAERSAERPQAADPQSPLVPLPAESVSQSAGSCLHARQVH